MNVSYSVESELSSDEFIDVLHRSTLAERRPVNSPATIAKMLKHASLIVTARVDDGSGSKIGRLVGVSRAITDFAYCTYLSDLAVDVAYQKKGIGRELIRHTHEAAGRETLLLLLAAPQAETYYEHIGFEKHNSCWTIPSSAKTDR